MSDDRRFDEPLPWLAAVEDEDEPRGLSARRMLAAVLVVIAAGLILAGTFFWLGRREPAGNGGPPELISAPAQPYKIRPPDPGGLDIRGESETAFETSAGEDRDAQLDLNKLPEAPIAKPAKGQPKDLVPEQPAADKAKPAAPETPPSGGSGSVVQLGAFANPAQAERAWTALSARFPGVASAGKMIVPFDGGTRLRASAGSPAAAKQLCQALKAAGENCFVAR